MEDVSKIRGFFVCHMQENGLETLDDIPLARNGLCAWGSLCQKIYLTSNYDKQKVSQF